MLGEWAACSGGSLQQYGLSNYCRLLEEERLKHANRGGGGGGWCWTPGLLVTFACSPWESCSPCAPLFTGLLLPSVASRGIAGKLHVAKKKKKKKARSVETKRAKRQLSTFTFFGAQLPAEHRAGGCHPTKGRGSGLGHSGVPGHFL